MVFLCLHPRSIVNFLSTHRDHFKPGALVTDVCGIKTAILEAAKVLPPEVDFIGCHPMAGKETSGIFYADAGLFRGAHFILTPRKESTPEHLALLERMAAWMGCRDVVKTTPEQHDAIIAYTSQMMHIIAVSVCDDPMLFTCKGFEGSSFRGCTRVAALDVPLWTELFSMNAPALTQVIRTLEDNLRSYRKVLEAGDSAALAQKLGLELVVDDMAFNAALTAAQTGQSDMVMAGVTVNEDRLAVMDFSDTYATGVQVVIVKEDSPIQTIDDLANAEMIGCQADTTGYIYCSYPPEEGGYGEDHVTAYDNGALAVMALVNGQVDAVVIDNAPAQEFVKANEGLKILDTEFAVEDYAIGFAKGNTALKDAVNAALKELIDDGTVQSIIDKYIPAE